MNTSNLPDFWPLVGYLFVLILIPYFILSLVFERRFSLKKLQYRKLYTYRSKPKKKQLRQEKSWSAVTSVIFAIVGASLLKLWENDLIPLYSELSSTDWWYIPMSIIIALLMHETLYYWLHRWMHNRHVFKYVHKVHHQSLSTSSWTALSFHPSEGLIQVLMLAVIIIVLPLHYSALLFLLILMSVSAIINHVGVDLYPKNSKFRKYVIGAKHHSLHHKHFSTNYGLYFTFWDRWMKTESDNFS